VVLVGQDGVQRPPIHFPKGGHLLAFLSCLENGLLPRGQLDPPLWSHRDKGVRLLFIVLWTFSLVGSRLWNALPREVVECQTLETFRRKLKHFLFSFSFPGH